MNRLNYLFSFLIPAAIALSFMLKGAWSPFAVIFSFGILPLLELALPELSQNLSPEEEMKIKNDPYFDWILWFMVPIQLGLMHWFLILVKNPDRTTGELIGLTLSMGIGCGVLGINVAHELGHRKNLFERCLARLLLSTSLNWQFYLEHNHGHHKNVSTPGDPESSHLNESIYAFWVRAIRDTFILAFRIDAREMTLALLIQIAIVVFVFLIYGPVAGVAFCGSAFGGILLLQSVNYIEHYGLSRKEIHPGQFEKVAPHHSWNADHFLSRAVLFDLSRHSDHHAHVTRKYQVLRHHDQSPQMPTGYPGMILLAMVPPLWFKVMNQEIEKANWTN